MIKTAEKSITLDRVGLTLTLVMMSRSFLLVLRREDDSVVPFNDKLALEGLSMALGDYSTSIYNSGDALGCSSLASRLSKSCNKNRPVYVSNMCGLSDELVSELYPKIFQFVRANLPA